MISQQMEEYLEAIGRLEEQGRPVTTSALADECHVAAPTVTEMLRRLSEQGLVNYRPRQAASLTPKGRSVAATVIRRHRLWERFLQDVLGLEWDELHAQACELEHATSPALERRLAEVLEGTNTCPHGHTIPGHAHSSGAGPLAPLSTVDPGQAVRVLSIEGEDGDTLRTLAALDVRPGALVCVEDAPAEGDLAISVGEQRGRLSRAVASLVTTRPLAPGEARLGDDRIPLSVLAPGESAILRSFAAGHGLVSRCLALGFTPGARVSMVQNAGHGPVIVLVRDTRVALGRGEAGKILVSREEGADGSAS